jgi:P27 family predicted phage terminase small subunit
MGLMICVPLNRNEVVAVPFRASLEAVKGDPMNGDLIKLPKARTSGDAIMSFEQPKSTPTRTVNTMPPSFLIDEIAREEWERVAASLFDQGSASLAKRSLLAGYCNAVARAVRAEHILTVEGRYYETRTKRGSLMRRRHPAAQDAEEGWTAARHLAKQLGLIGGSLGERRGEGSRRRVFK